MLWDVVPPESVDLVEFVVVSHVEVFALLGLHEGELFSIVAVLGDLLLELSGSKHSVFGEDAGLKFESGPFDHVLILDEVLVIWLPEISGVSVDGRVERFLLFFEEVCGARHFLS